MKIFEYKNYDDYVVNQTRANKIKLDWVYVRENTIQKVVSRKKDAASILCHGTRNGAEQRYFKNMLPDAYVIGTEISDTANTFEMTVQHDFSEPKDEWIHKFDIVYSNSVDHSIDPKKTLLTWKNQLTDDGLLFIEYAEAQSICDVNDPLEATNQEIKNMIVEAGLIIIETITKEIKHAGLVFVCKR